jgi:hypothetical protein
MLNVSVYEIGNNTLYDSYIFSCSVLLVSYYYMHIMNPYLYILVMMYPLS